MKGLINIFAAFFVALCMHACRTHVRTCVEEVSHSTGSFGSVSTVQASDNIDIWKAADIMTNFKSGSWKHIRIYDTSRPGTPLLMDIEQKDSTHTNNIVSQIDSVKSSSMVVMNDSVNGQASHDEDIHVEKERDFKETMSDIIKWIGITCFWIVIAYGIYVLYKKIF